MQTRKITTKNGLQIAARVTGEGEDVLLLHGIPGSAAVWESVTEELGKTHRVIAPDLIGFGRSSRTGRIEDLWTGNQADCLIELLDTLGTDEVHVVGHDYGGPVAAALYDRMADRFRSLILASTNTFGDTPVPFPLSGVLWLGIGGLWERLLFSRPSLAMMVKSGTGIPKPEHLDLEPYLGDRGQVRSIRIIFATALRELSERYEPVTGTLSRCTVPAAVLWGDRDPFFSIEQGQRTAALINKARFIRLEGAGHFLPEERPKEIIEAVRSMS
jgi:pimeloyl-ACP methyl ester carboxylesterase